MMRSSQFTFFLFSVLLTYSLLILPTESNLYSNCSQYFCVFAVERCIYVGISALVDINRTQLRGKMQKNWHSLFNIFMPSFENLSRIFPGTRNSSILSTPNLRIFAE